MITVITATMALTGRMVIKASRTAQSAALTGMLLMRWLPPTARCLIPEPYNPIDRKPVARLSTSTMINAAISANPKRVVPLLLRRSLCQR